MCAHAKRKPTEEETGANNNTKPSEYSWTVFDVILTDTFVAVLCVVDYD